jgi:hypothetical protein
VRGMRLTSTYTRVAMPDHECPYCHKSFDWHREWYSKSEQTQLYQKKFASDCPECHGLAWLRTYPEEITQKEFQDRKAQGDEIKLLRRTRVNAWAWVNSEKNKGQVFYPDLDSYLQSQDVMAQPYKSYVFREDSQSP